MAGYSNWILSPRNDSIFEQNKIGIFSLGGKIKSPFDTFFIIYLGYCCLFLMSCYIGKLHLNLRIDHSKYRTNVFFLALISGTLWIAFLMTVNEILPSRPLANLTYVLWGLANGSLHFLIFALFDSIFPEQFRFIIFAEMVSEYRLSVFILANLMSTIIRKVSDIKSKSMLYTMKFVYSYLFLACLSVAFFFYRRHIKELAITLIK